VHRFSKHIINFFDEIIRSPFIVADETSSILYSNVSAVNFSKEHSGFFEKTVRKQLDVYFKSFNEVESPISQITPDALSSNDFPLFDEIILTKFFWEDKKLFGLNFIQDLQTQNLEIVYPVNCNIDCLPFNHSIKKIIKNFNENYKSVTQRDFEKFESANNFEGKIWIKNGEGKYEYVNNYFSKITAVAVDELIGLDEQQIISVGKQKYFELIDNFIFVSGNSVLIQKNNFQKRDVDQINWLIKYPILNSENKVISIISVDYNSQETLQSFHKTLGVELSTNSFSENLQIMQHTAIDNSDIPSLLFNSDNFQIINVNEKFCKLYGYTSEEAKTKSVLDLIPVQDIQMLLSVNYEEKALKNIGPIQNIKKDGSLLPVLIKSLPVDYEDQKVILFRIYPEEKKYKPLQNKYSQFNLLPAPVAVTDRNGFIIFVNEILNGFLKYSDVELDNRPFISLFADEDKLSVGKFFDDVEHDGNIKLKAKLKSSGNNQKPFEITGKFLEKEDEFLFLFNEIKTSKTSAQIEEPVKKNNKSLQIDFLIELFHELRTPINVILGFVHEIYESIENPSDEQKESAEIIFQNQKILLQIMDAAAQYAQLELGENGLNISQLTLHEILSKVKDNLNYQLNKNGVDLISEKAGGELKSDYSKLSAFLFHILKFAIHSTPSGKLYLRSYEQENKVFIGLRDNEDNISQGFLEKLNLAFATKELTDSNNIGIPEIVIKLSRKLSSILEIKTEIISTNNLPFEFAFVLPKNLQTGLLNEQTKTGLTGSPVKNITNTKPETVNNHIQDTKTIEYESAAKNNNGKIDLSNLSCLYFEDQLDSQLLFKTQFKDLKHLDVVSSLEEALPLLEKSKFDFIVMDINLEGKFNGMNALKIVRKFEEFKNTPVIAVTAYDLPTEHAKYLSLGFNDYLPKPFLRDDVLQSLKKIL